MVVVGARVVVGALDDEVCEEDLRPVNASQMPDILIDSCRSARYRDQSKGRELREWGRCCAGRGGQTERRVRDISRLESPAWDGVGDR